MNGGDLAVSRDPCYQALRHHDSDPRFAPTPSEIIDWGLPIKEIGEFDISQVVCLWKFSYKGYDSEFYRIILCFDTLNHYALWEASLVHRVIKDAPSEITKAEAEDPCAEDSRKPDGSSVSEDGKEEQQTQVQMSGLQVHKDQGETNSSAQEKVLKKPDKILHRYWTAGGTMRNVPVGAGRRKNKHLASQYRQIMVSSDGVPTTVIEASDSSNQQILSCGETSTTFRPSTASGTVLKFGPEAPLCKSMETVLSIREQKRCAEMRTVNCGGNGEEPSSCASSVSAPSFPENEFPENVGHKDRPSLPASRSEIHPQLHQPCYPVPPWAFPWNPGWTNVAPVAPPQCSSDTVYAPNNSNPIQFSGTGNISLAGSNDCLSPSSSTSNSCSGNASPTLGKHSRDAQPAEEQKLEKCVLVPKTLRIIDPDEASKSSIWATLGIKPDQKAPISKGGIFKAFEPKSGAKTDLSDATQVLEANPAALSRSQTFKEST
ncbi:Cyclic dof factor 2 [Vitis vinifera]|uniref:Cyclic dof factor 2 n=1 Tax=Vitis vinifera TaxID=29760 RepID=A0A438DHG2_VITVI|nr:Cyclic dof factor 2 [Vitis vinifera]